MQSNSQTESRCVLGRRDVAPEVGATREKVGLDPFFSLQRKEAVDSVDSAAALEGIREVVGIVTRWVVGCTHIWDKKMRIR